MKKEDYRFTFEGFKFWADFEITTDGVDITYLGLESGIDDELIEVKDMKRVLLVEKHLEKIFETEIDSLCATTWKDERSPDSSTFRPGH